MTDDKKITLLSLEKRVRELEAKAKDGSSYGLGEIKHCYLCKKDMPAMIEELHAHVKHGL